MIIDLEKLYQEILKDVGDGTNGAVVKQEFLALLKEKGEEFLLKTLGREE